MSFRHRPGNALRRFLTVSLGVDLECDSGLLAECGRAMSEGDWRALPAASDSHGITLCVAKALVQIGYLGPDDAVSEVRQRALAHRGAALRTQVGLEWLIPFLERLPGGWVLLKGAVLADFVYRPAGLRSFSDIDVLISPRDVRDGLSAIEAAGGCLVTRNWKYLDEQDKREVTIRLPNGSYLDLHWNLLATPSRAPGVRLNTHKLIAGRRTIRLRGLAELPTYALAVEDQLIHVAVHGVLAGFGPLRASVDLDQSLRHDLPEVSDFKQRATETGTSLIISVAVARTKAALGPAPVSPEIERALRGHSGTVWRRAMGVNDKLNPPSRSHQPVPLQWLTGATRETTSASVHSLGRFIVDRSGAIKDPRIFVQRLRRGVQTVDMLDVELADVDDGHRESMLRRVGSLQS